MASQDQIIKLARAKGRVATSDVVKALRVSRVYAARLCRGLTEAGRLVRVGRTRGAYYILPGKIELVKPLFRRRLKNTDLEEDRVLKSVYEKIPSLEKLPQNARRIFDYTFSLENFDYRLLVDNTLNDVFVEKLTTPRRGTLVTLTIALRTKKQLAEIFQHYQTGQEEFAFDKTEVLVKLYTLGMRYVSRSEARRVLARLEKFRRVILDFDQVATIGQAFADEIFRVYNNQHPEVEMLSTHANEAVQFMINRVKKST